MRDYLYFNDDKMDPKRRQKDQETDSDTSKISEKNQSEDSDTEEF